MLLIAPVEGASFEDYSPWNTRGAKAPNPHVALVHIAEAFPPAKWGEASREPSDDLLEAVVSWANRFGLLGVMVDELQSVTLPPVIGAEGFDVQDRWSRDGRHWNGKRTVVLEPADTRPAECSVRRIDGSRQTYSVEQLWSRHGLPTKPVVSPWDDGFWIHYAEPIWAILQRADVLRRVTSALAQRGETLGTGLEWLRRYIRHVSPVVFDDGVGPKLRWTAPSLWSALAMMVALDATGGGHLRTCAAPDCGRLFRTENSRTVFCGSRCKSRVAMRRMRDKRRGEEGEDSDG